MRATVTYTDYRQIYISIKAKNHLGSSVGYHFSILIFIIVIVKLNMTPEYDYCKQMRRRCA